MKCNLEALKKTDMGGKRENYLIYFCQSKVLIICKILLKTLATKQKSMNNLKFIKTIVKIATYKKFATFLPNSLARIFCFSVCCCFSEIKRGGGGSKVLT